MTIFTPAENILVVHKAHRVLVKLHVFQTPRDQSLLVKRVGFTVAHMKFYIRAQNPHAQMDYALLLQAKGSVEFYFYGDLFMVIVIRFSIDLF